RRADDARDREAPPRRADASRRAARGGHLAGRNDDPSDSRARARRGESGLPERDSGGDGALAGAGRRRAVNDAEIHVVDDPARAVAELLKQAKGHVALSGGSSPKRAYELARECRDWSSVTFWWSDERCVLADDEPSNYGMAKAALLDHVELGQVHRIRGELGGEEAARIYEELL